MLSKEEKTERMVQFLTESHIQTHGGYPYDYIIRGDVLFVAALDDRKERARTEAIAYSIAGLSDWYDRAAEYIRTSDDLFNDWPEEFDFDFGDWCEAFGETESEVESGSGSN